MKLDLVRRQEEWGRRAKVKDRGNGRQLKEGQFKNHPNQRNNSWPASSLTTAVQERRSGVCQDYYVTICVKVKPKPLN